VRKYYDVLWRHPDQLYRFYKDNSTQLIVDMASSPQAKIADSIEVQCGHN
jgi:hypothetical protein